MKKKSRNFEPKLWTTKEVRRFKQLYPMSHNKNLTKIFGRTISAIGAKARKLGIKKDWDRGYQRPQYWRGGIIWTKGAIKVLRKMYINSSNKEIAAKLKLSRQTVESKIKKLKLSQEFKEQGLTRKKDGHANKWTDREISILKKLYLQKSNAQIAKKLGRSEKAVDRKASKLGITADTFRKNPWTAKDEAFLKKYITKWPVERIAKKFGCSPQSVVAKARRLGLKNTYATSKRKH